MKTSPMQHQKIALSRSEGKVGFAYFCEQGTGKTWMILADAERAYGAGKIDGLLVVAPKGVDANWINREIPEHLEAAHIARLYRSNPAAKRELLELMRPREKGEIPPLRIMAMNYEALATKAGYDVAFRFLNSISSMMVLDESRRIKNPGSIRSKRVISLAIHAKLRRIGTGTPVANSPVDAFNQFEFLESGLLGTTSYRAFIAEYAELLAEDHHLMRHIKSRIGNRFAAPQIVATNPDGTKRWRNLDKLHTLIAPHSYRVLKRDCMDLPEKIYRTHFFDMTPRQRLIYEKMEKDLRIELGGGEILSVQRLAAVGKLQQITSGFFHDSSGEPRGLIDVEGVTPRLAALAEVIEDLEDDESFIVFARFREELRMVAELLAKKGISSAQYHGGVKDSARESAVDDFQAGRVRAFIAQPRSGGIGLTLTKATTVIYYSNYYDLEERQQSEDRAHRKGTTRNVVYVDLAAANSIDERIACDLQRKSTVSQIVLGDFPFEKK